MVVRFFSLLHTSLIKYDNFHALFAWMYFFFTSGEVYFSVLVIAVLWRTESGRAGDRVKKYIYFIVVTIIDKTLSDRFNA